MMNKEYHDKCFKNAMFVWKEYENYERAKLNLLASISRSLASLADSYDFEHGIEDDGE